MKTSISLFLLSIIIVLGCEPQQITISGYIYNLKHQAIPEVLISFSNEGGNTKTDSSGFYSKDFPQGWSGTVTPFEKSYDFIPKNRNYANVIVSLDSQNFRGYGLNDPPAPPTDLQVINVDSQSLKLKWTDNSSNEDGFIVRRSIAQDTSFFVVIDTLAADSAQFLVQDLEPLTYYIFRVSALSGMKESEYAQNSGCPGLNRPNELTVSPRSNTKIFLTWKDNSNNENGFIIEYYEGDCDDNLAFLVLSSTISANTKFYLASNLKQNTTYTFRVRAKLGSCQSGPSNEDCAKTQSITSIEKHSNGLELDNQGGGADGWSYFNFNGSGRDLLYDGHLQISANNVVYDGDDKDLTSTTSIKLYPPTPDQAYEHTALETDPCNPIVMKCNSVNIEVKQFTYYQTTKNWNVIEWIVENKTGTSMKIKLAFFLDADVNEYISTGDMGGFDLTNKIVYLYDNLNTRWIGMALVKNTSYYQSYQISKFIDSRTPDNSYKTHNNGDVARQDLFNNLNTEILCSGPEDLTMTLVCDLGTIINGGNKKIYYAIAVANTLNDLKTSISDAASFALSASPCPEE